MFKIISKKTKDVVQRYKRKNLNFILTRNKHISTQTSPNAIKIEETKDHYYMLVVHQTKDGVKSCYSYFNKDLWRVNKLIKSILLDHSIIQKKMTFNVEVKETK